GIRAALHHPFAFEQELAGAGGELGPGRAEVDALFVAIGRELTALPGGLLARPRANGAARQAEALVRDHLLPVDPHHPAEPAAAAAGAEGRLVGEEAAPRRLEARAARRADQP